MSEHMVNYYPFTPENLQEKLSPCEGQITANGDKLTTYFLIEDYRIDEIVKTLNKVCKECNLYIDEIINYGEERVFRFKLISPEEAKRDSICITGFNYKDEEIEFISEDNQGSYTIDGKLYYSRIIKYYRYIGDKDKKQPK